MGADRTDEEYWLQKWITIAQSIGITKTQLLNDYYFDEFIAVMDQWNTLHTPEDQRKVEVYADEIDE